MILFFLRFLIKKKNLFNDVHLYTIGRLMHGQEINNKIKPSESVKSVLSQRQKWLLLKKSI